MKQTTTLLLTILFFNFSAVTIAFSQTNSDKEAQKTAKLKARVLEFGTGRDAKIKVSLKDKRTVKGFVSAADTDSVTITDRKTDAQTEIPYGQLKKVSRDDLSAGAKYGILAAIAVPVAIVVGLLVIRACNESAC